MFNFIIMKTKEFKYPELKNVKQVSEEKLKQLKGGCWTCTTCSPGQSVTQGNN